MPAKLIDQPLAIHAARVPFCPSQWGDDLRRQLSADDVREPFPYGHILCVVHPGRSITTKEWKALFEAKAKQLHDSAVTDDFWVKQRERYLREFHYGNYADLDGDSGKKRWATPLMDIRVLPEPIPYVGRQGFFDWPEGDELYKELW